MNYVAIRGLAALLPIFRKPENTVELRGLIITENRHQRILPYENLNMIHF